MPKIDAATVVEHRAARRAALLEAAVALLHEHPNTLPSLGDVGTRAGLSRSSVYHYFASSEALMSAVLEETFPRWQRQFEAAYAVTETPEDRVLAYVRENLALVASGQHALAQALRSVVPGDELAARSAAFHADLTAPLAAALAELGEPDVRVTTELVNALVLTGARLLEAGESLATVTAAVERLLAPYLFARP